MKLVEIDLRVGGTWRYVMEAQRRLRGRLPRRVPRARARTSGSSPPRCSRARRRRDAGDVLNIITFAEADGRTTLELLVQCPSREIRDMIIDSGMEGGMQEQYDALEELVISLSD